MSLGFLGSSFYVWCYENHVCVCGVWILRFPHESCSWDGRCHAQIIFSRKSSSLLALDICHKIHYSFWSKNSKTSTTCTRQSVESLLQVTWIIAPLFYDTKITIFDFKLTSFRRKSWFWNSFEIIFINSLLWWICFLFWVIFLDMKLIYKEFKDIQHFTFDRLGWN